MANTQNYNIPKPVETANIDQEMRRLQSAWDLVDLVLKSLADLVAGKAASVHVHDFEQITGLVAALQGKMPANKTFAFTDLTDVIGFVGAATGYIPQKSADGKIILSSPAAVLGNHQHSTSDIQGLPALIQTYITALVNSSPAALDTLKELATAIGNDANFATTMTNALAGKLSLAGGTMGGKLGLPSVSETSFAQGTGDGASYTTYNTIFKGWWGMGMATHDNSINGFYDFRMGIWDVKGGFRVNGNVVPHGGNKATAADIAAGTANKFPDAAAVKTALASFTSGQQTITLGSTVSVAHGLGVIPSIVQFDLICTTAEFGWSVGQVTQVPCGILDISGISPGAIGIGIEKTSTNITARFPLSYIKVPNKAANDGTAISITPANWRLVIRASP